MFRQLFQIESDGETLDDAVEGGLAHFGCSRAEVEIDILQLPARKLFGLFGSTPARVRLRLNDRAFVARKLAEKLLELSGFDARVDIRAGSDHIELLIQEEKSSLVIGRRGSTLDALQSLVVTLTDRRVEDRTPILLDIDGYRQRRKGSLRRLARRLSSQVRRNGKNVTVNPLPPEERRLFHLAIKEEFGVDCRSIGHGFEKKMILSPRKS